MLKRVRQARRSELICICKYLDIAKEEREGLWAELSLKELRERVVAEVRKSVVINDTSRSGLLVGYSSHQYLFIVAIVFTFVAWRLYTLGMFDTKKYLYFM